MTTREQVEIADGGLSALCKALPLGPVDNFKQGFDVHGLDFITAIKYKSSKPIIYRNAKAAYKLGMDIADTRRERLLNYAKQKWERDELAQLAEELGKSQSQISQIVGKNPTRNIGPGLARQIEAAIKKPKYWLDGKAGITPEEESILEDLRILSDEERARFADAARFAASTHRAGRKKLNTRLQRIGGPDAMIHASGYVGPERRHNGGAR